MTTTCRLCQTPGAGHRTLVHPVTDTQATVCPICLRTKTHAKAARGDPRARHRLEQEARRAGREVWQGENTVYLTPPILPSLEEEAIVERKPQPSKPSHA